MNILREKQRALGWMPCKGGGSSTSSSEISYPDEIKPLLSNVANLSTDLYNKQWQGYGSPRYADLNDTQQQALQGIADRATGGSQLWGQAQGSLQQMMGDQQNPYLDQQVANAQKSLVDSYNLTTKPQLESAMVGSGSFGNSGLQQMQQQSQNQLQQNLGNVATQMYGDAFNTNQANRLQALGMAQGFANQDYTDLNQLLGAGNTYQDQAQNNADFAYDQWQQQQDDPYRKLQAMTGVMSGTAGSTTTTKQSGGK
ncbi:hypothetical protein [Alicycliphilus denitrificans]|uniref:Uncharacterized protein n=1 Tax=Alicycliphilus denitrificans TaxID=179636 RepID=A0A420KBY4_9BURK|nr:hypothetical protein [Alicycliphilus denitrificans]RKJ96634.1 hypothetical protein CE154_011465 [Alicycliphilus denitrificans]